MRAGRTAARLSLVFLALCVAGAPAAAWYRVCRAGDRAALVWIEGERASAGDGGVRRLAEKKTLALLERRVVLEGEGLRETPTLAELGFVPDLEETLARVARAAAPAADPVEDFLRALALRRGEARVRAAVRLDEGVALEWLLDLKRRADRFPVDAKVRWAGGMTVTAEEPGLLLDVYAALAAVEEAVARRGELAVPLSFVEAAPSVTAAALRQLTMQTVIATFTTKFARAGTHAPRARNIALAASRFDGTILMPGGVTSFNKVVGPRTTEEGFEEAQEIYEGRMVEGVGGGTCQVASTVHAAAFLGGLEILEDYRHSRPSAYIPMGLDATVVWPTLDLKLRNPYPFPVVFDVVVEKNRLTVALRGAARPAKVTWSKKVLLEIPFEEAVETDDELPAGSVVVAQEGINGYKIEKTRVIALDGGGETTETTVDFYPPTTRIVTIAPGATYAPAAVAPAPAATGDTAVPP